MKRDCFSEGAEEGQDSEVGSFYLLILWSSVPEIGQYGLSRPPISETPVSTSSERGLWLHEWEAFSTWGQQEGRTLWSRVAKDSAGNRKLQVVCHTCGRVDGFPQRL